jgi:cell division protein FtsB
MSGHADIRQLQRLSDERDALVAENQRLRDALETTEEWAHEQGYDVLAKRLRAALAGTPSEDTG